MTSPQKTRKTRFVLLAGLPGSGKTALAEALSERFGGIVLSKDRVRSALFPPGAIDFSETQDDFCMSLIVQAARMIAAKRTVPFVFFDGRTFSRTSQIEQVVQAAAEAGADCRILHLHCPDELALERIRQGVGQHPAANRDATLYWEMKSRFEPITLPKLDVDTSRSLDECVLQCVECLQG